MPVGMSIKVDTIGLVRRLNALQRKQIPFASSQALNATAFEVLREANMDVRVTLKHPRPFTQKAFAVIKSTKATQTATVFLKPDHRYLAPYIIGGLHILPSKRLFTPVDIRLDAYGQLQRGKLKALSALADQPGSSVFFGTVHGVTGFWQRPPRGTQRTGGKGTKGNIASDAGFSTGLRLLVRVGDNVPVHEKIVFFQTAEHVARVTFPKFFRKAFAWAMLSAK